jgi:membrane protein
MTIGGAFILLLGVAALVAGSDAGFWIARHLHVGAEYVFVGKWARWPVTAVLMMLFGAIGYYVLPDVEQEFRFLRPGAVAGTLLSLTATWVFSAYAAHFGSYNATYGTIGGVIILMTWFYITGFIYLMGGEVNAILEHGSPQGKAKGARAAGEAAPPPSQRPSAMPVGAADAAATAARSNAAPPSPA